VSVKRFADGETYVRYGESIRGCDVYLVQPTAPPVNESFMVGGGVVGDWLNRRGGGLGKKGGGCA
jgi:hypothetical protein